MGDLRTHETIASAVIAELKSVRLEDDYIFFHLGNWLTDMSQFRDWPAYSQAKISIWKTVSDTGGFEGFAINVGNMRHLYLHLNGYLDALFGGEKGYLWR